MDIQVLLFKATAGSDFLAVGSEAAALAHGFEGGENVHLWVYHCVVCT